MKTWLVVAAATVLGIGLGWGTTYAKYGLKGPIERLVERKIPFTDLPYKPPAGGPMPKIVIDQEEFDHGKIEADSRVRHAFKISNFGSYPLVIESGGTSCSKCTFSDLEMERVVHPGQTTLVTVEYNATAVADHFRQGAVLLTNDPERPKVTLAVVGKVQSSFTLSPSRLVLGQMSANETRTVELRVLANLIDDLQVSNPEFIVKSTAEFFAAEIQPILPDELPKEAKSGALVKIAIKPGLPFGAVRQTIRLATNLPGQTQLEVPIDGTVEGDLNIAGPHFDDKNKVLTLGTVSSQKGSKNTLMMLLRGPDRAGVEIKIAKCDPEWLKAEVGATVAPEGASFIRVPLTIEIPEGAPTAIRMGTAQGKLGVIEIESTHPRAKKFNVYVQFAVEQ